MTAARLWDIRPGTFKAIASSPVDWWLSAENLHRAAEAVYANLTSAERVHVDSTPAGNWISVTPWIEPLGPYLMLAGLALENLLKGLRLSAKHPGDVHDSSPGVTRISSRVAIHDLARLAELAGATVNAREARLLRLLTAAVADFGRFPLALTSDTDPWLGPDEDVDGDEVRAIIATLYDRWAEQLMRDVPGDPIW